MKNKIFILLTMLLTLISFKEVKAESYNDTVDCRNYVGYQGNVYYYSIKQDKEYPISCTNNSFNIENAINILNNNGSLLDHELDNIDSFLIADNTNNRYLVPLSEGKYYQQRIDNYLYSFDIKTGTQYDKIEILDTEGMIIEKGSLFAAYSITVNGKTTGIFYADKDYVITEATGSYYQGYFTLEEAPNQSEEPDPNLNDYKLDLECLSDKEENHHYELYYKYPKTDDDSAHEISFRLKYNNLKGQISIDGKNEEINNDKEYKAEAKCEEDGETCKVLVARIVTENIDSNKASSIEIVPVSLKIDEETYSLGVDNSICQYQKVIDNPTTSSHHIIFIAIILIICGGLQIILKKKKILTKI